ncbi:MAG: hypothetical protein WCJ30_12585 [Deltaproteobacteria bacterium]
MFTAALSGTYLTRFLTAWAQRSPRGVVRLLDEIDAVRGQSLISVLRQLRDGYPDRPDNAPWSVMLCGLRDVREYKTASGGDGGRLGTSSPFNVKVESLALEGFSEVDVRALLGQHTVEAGQPFDEEAIARIVELAGEQPWLVNANCDASGTRRLTGRCGRRLRNGPASNETPSRGQARRATRASGYRLG